MDVTLTAEAWDGICQHAVETFPEECCGVIFKIQDRDEVRRCTNIQNRLHALDPETYPRTAATAYTLDPRELDSITRQAESTGGKIKAFYHSHPDHGAYFSLEDKACAIPFGEPTYPDSAQIVISVLNRAVRDARAYIWDKERSDFIEISLRRLQ